MAIEEIDLGDGELLAFALNFAGSSPAAPVAAHLLDEFGDVEVILASDPSDLRSRGGLDNRSVAILKLLHAFRSDNRRDMLLN
ncbi:hypothetical protein [Glacieibacterium sp.]|uniref:hypothetical protein n=1 Tax=Glacieibacterium sp. TaxID=2860237 RepID=UPI003AFFAA8A